MKMDLTKAIYLLIIGVFVLACSSQTDKEVGIREIIKVDHDFSNYSVKNGMNKAFYKFAHDSAVILRDNSYPIVGREKIKELFSARKDSLFTLSWEPSFANVSNSGDMGYTYGIYKLETTDTVLKGTYLSIWKKDADSNWKFVLDTGNQGLGN